MYGISETDKIFLKTKLENQKKFLDSNFFMINGEYVPYSNFYFSSWHNSNRYIAELNNRVASLNDYAQSQGLCPIFAVFTLPSEYHKQKLITLKSGKKKLVYNKKYIDDEDHSVSAGASKLQSLVRSIMNSLHFRSLSQNQRCYITTKEPHLDGTCHLNLLVFVPKEKINDCVIAIKSRFLDTHSRVETDIKNATSYVMKYIFKTLDDLRQNPDLDNLTDISYWYLKHKIRRFTMSKTFVSLEIYRKLNGRVDLISLTKNYNKGLVTVLLDPETKKPLQIFDEFGDLWHKIKVSKDETTIRHQNVSSEIKDFGNNLKQKQILKLCDELFKSDEKPKPVSRMKDYELVNYYQSLGGDVNAQHLAYVENLMLDRELDKFTHYHKKHDLNAPDIDSFVDRCLICNEF
ncbi:replication endonuclease [Campylobacter concisus]|uniref:replication endonuclease n=1 Tax=Campylobacter concisus TaxID=199 RepID=UPI0018AB87EB|nr:replication endonuclease [Campylobacter concisus]QPI02869.1 replication endonuclease [Campylobacter concisus]